MLRLTSLAGILIFVLIGFLLSENKKGFSWRIVCYGLGFQLILAVIFFNIPTIQMGLLKLNSIVLGIDKATKVGASFMFGYLGGGQLPFTLKPGGNSFIIAFQILPIIIVMSAISSLLFHLGILQRMIVFISRILAKTFGLRADVAIGVGASIFLGIIEAPLLIKHYLIKMDRSSLFTVFSAAMATVAGTVMLLYANIVNHVIEGALGHILIASLLSAPAAIMFSQILIPPEKKDLENGGYQLKAETKSSFEAIINGTMEGVQMCLAICGVIIVFFAFISLFNQFLALFPGQITLQKIVSFIFYPFVFLMGVSPNDIPIASELMATKTLLNEFAAYMKLGDLQAGAMSERSSLILMYAMCGFANLGSVGILVGALGTIMPERKQEVAILGLKGILSGTLATMCTGAIIGLIHI